jgi:hypothetical protein
LQTLGLRAAWFIDSCVGWLLCLAFPWWFEGERALRCLRCGAVVFDEQWEAHERFFHAADAEGIEGSR